MAEGETGGRCSHVVDLLDRVNRRGAVWCGRSAALGIPQVNGAGTLNLCSEHAAVYVATLAHRVAQQSPECRAAVSEVLREALSDPLFGAPQGLLETQVTL